MIRNGPRSRPPVILPTKGWYATVQTASCDATEGEVRRTPLNDQNSLSLLIYDRGGEHLGWHHDHNFYRGRDFALLVPLLNIGSDENGQSHAQLYVRLPGQAERVINTIANQRDGAPWVTRGSIPAAYPGARTARPQRPPASTRPISAIPTAARASPRRFSNP